MPCYGCINPNNACAECKPKLEQLTMRHPDTFQAELKTLLLKYNASIDFDFDECADTHGLGNSGMALYMDGKCVRHFPYEQTIGPADLTGPEASERF